MCEGFALIVSSVGMYQLYLATRHWFTGFSFLLLLILQFIALLLTLLVQIIALLLSLLQRCQPVPFLRGAPRLLFCLLFFHFAVFLNGPKTTSDRIFGSPKSSTWIGFKNGPKNEFNVYNSRWDGWLARVQSRESAKALADNAPETEPLIGYIPDNNKLELETEPQPDYLDNSIEISTANAIN